MDPRRTQRVSEALREELAELIGYELSDPRLAAVVVTEVHVTPDLRHASVMVALGREPDEASHALEALDHARHYLRRQLSVRFRLWRVPELRFEADTGGQGPNRIDQLLHRVRKEREKNSASRQNQP